jgi:hypothetical protein
MVAEGEEALVPARTRECYLHSAGCQILKNGQRSPGQIWSTTCSLCDAVHTYVGELLDGRRPFSTRANGRPPGAVCTRSMTCPRGCSAVATCRATGRPAGRVEMLRRSARSTRSTAPGDQLMMMATNTSCRCNACTTRRIPIVMARLDLQGDGHIHRCPVANRQLDVRLRSVIVPLSRIQRSPARSGP